MSLLQIIWCYVRDGEGTHKRRFYAGVKTQAWQPFNNRLWQRNYCEHIIRDDSALQKIQQYVRDNPLTWQTDSLHPDVPSKY